MRCALTLLVLWLAPNQLWAQGTVAELDQDIDQVLIISGKGGALAEEVVRRRRLLSSALIASPVAETPRTNSKHTLVWQFKNSAERARKILELQIRLSLLTGNQRVWKRLEVQPLQRVDDLCEGTLLNTSDAKFFPRLIRRLAPDTVLLQVFPVNETGQMVPMLLATANVTAQVEQEFELNRLSGFYVVVDGTYALPNETGVETIAHGRYVDAAAVRRVTDFAKREPLPSKAFPWSSADEKFNTQATVVEVLDDSVILQRSDGLQIRVPFTRLSEASVKLALAYRDALQPLVDPLISYQPRAALPNAASTMVNSAGR